MREGSETEGVISPDRWACTFLIKLCGRTHKHRQAFFVTIFLEFEVKSDNLRKTRRKTSPDQLLAAQEPLGGVLHARWNLIDKDPSVCILMLTVLLCPPSLLDRMGGQWIIFYVCGPGWWRMQCCLVCGGHATVHIAIHQILCVPLDVTAPECRLLQGLIICICMYTGLLLYSVCSYWACYRWMNFELWTLIGQLELSLTPSRLEPGVSKTLVVCEYDLPNRNGWKDFYKKCPSLSWFYHEWDQAASYIQSDDESAAEDCSWDDDSRRIHSSHKQLELSYLILYI